MRPIEARAKRAKELILAAIQNGTFKLTHSYMRVSERNGSKHCDGCALAAFAKAVCNIEPTKKNNDGIFPNGSFLNREKITESVLASCGSISGGITPHDMAQLEMGYEGWAVVTVLDPEKAVIRRGGFYNNTDYPSAYAQKSNPFWRLGRFLRNKYFRAILGNDLNSARKLKEYHFLSKEEIDAVRSRNAHLARMRAVQDAERATDAVPVQTTESTVSPQAQ